MKKVLLALIYTLASYSAHAKDMVVAISPHLSERASQNMLTEMATLYSGLALGDTLIFLDGSNANTIASIAIPNDDAYRHRVARLRYGAKPLAKLDAFIQSMAPGHRTLGAMDVPLIFSQIARHYPNASEILLVGSALYDSPSQPGLDMTTMLIPSDGFITAKPTDSPFGTRGREKHLSGKRIHWLLPAASSDSLHSEALSRFMHLYIHHMGGSLVSFTHNHDAAMQLLLSNARPLPMLHELEASGKLFMRSVRKLVPEHSLYQQPVSDEKPPQHVLNNQQTLVLGIEWQGEGVDIDIYARPEGGETLSYKNPRSSQGRHYKDVLSGNTQSHGSQYETIEFDHAVEPSGLKIALNVYSMGQELQSINGTLRLQLGEKTYAAPFQFRVAKGNSGKDVNSVLNGEGNTAYSQLFTVSEIVGGGEAVL